MKASEIRKASLVKRKVAVQFRVGKYGDQFPTYGVVWSEAVTRVPARSVSTARTLEGAFEQMEQAGKVHRYGPTRSLWLFEFKNRDGDAVFRWIESRNIIGNADEVEAQRRQDAERARLHREQKEAQDAKRAAAAANFNARIDYIKHSKPEVYTLLLRDSRRDFTDTFAEQRVRVLDEIGVPKS